MNNLYRLSAFYKTDRGGNKAGVYLNADELSSLQMQKIAKEVGYSETAFVTKSSTADFKLRFFTPKNEVELCGHATIAAFNLLRDLKIITPGLYTQETKAGILKLEVMDSIVFMEQLPPTFFEVVEKSDLDQCFMGLVYDLDLLPQVVSTGIKEIFLPIKDLNNLNQIIPNFEAIIYTANKYNCIGIHAFTLNKEVDAYGRNFAPIVGIDEESATVTSNGALACFIHRYYKKKDSYILRQGYSMNQPSEIIVRLKTDNYGEITKVIVGGKAKII
jgi:PhzF family phenazine biosynthesis protein